MTLYSDAKGKLANPGGSHTVIQVGDTIYDNFRPGGIPASEFWDDIGKPFLDKSVAAGGARIQSQKFK